MPKEVIIRCRKCWEDVAVQKETDPVQRCPRCGRKQTYVHAVVPKDKKKEKEEKKGASLGATSPG